MSDQPDLKSTIHLPSTPFKMKANLAQREPEILDWWDKIDVHARIQERRAGRDPYVLHDGPPYANGNIHLGQALNKILKDFVVKSRSMMGHDSAYVPGWDCHGLPIEIRVDKELGPKKQEMHALQIRHRCRKYAEKFIGIQRKEFRRLGVFWDRNLDTAEEKAAAPSRKAIYRTIDRTYEAEIVRQLGRFFVNGSVYHGVKPVHWCFSCKTALAEAEVEHDDRTDPSVYVKFPLRGADKRVAELAGRSVSLLIWTTTPWTLPANLAITLHPTLPYVAVARGDEAVIVAEGLLEEVAAKLGWESPEVVARFTGAELAGEGDDWAGTELTVERPYLAPAGPAAGDGVVILGEHVTLEAGTGCVHTAPGHGADDFNVGRKYGLETFNPVGDDGHYVAAKVAPELADQFVLDANAWIVDDLRRRGWLLHDEAYSHSYPHCWRCKNPVLFRSTPQWFISMDATGLREKALEQIRRTRWLPAFGEARIHQMIEGRPDWCISRQRTWGVPIPAVVCGDCLEENEQAFVRDPALFEHIVALFEAEGSDAWFGVPEGDEGRLRPYRDDAERLARLVPESITCPECNKRDGLTLHEHIVDVWFESGASHGAVLGRQDRLPWPADLYLEGHDQYRGWFHSSLLVAVNDRGLAPYRGVVTHGFTLDGDGRKMSKSIGNTVSPLDIAGTRGSEILRLWVCGIDFLEDMRMSEEVLARNAEAYRKVRNTFRYLLGNLNEFDPARDCMAYDEMEEIDRWALQLLEQRRRRWIEAYEANQYHVLYHGLHNYCSVDLSSLYLDVLKDRLYTYPENSDARRSARTALWRIARDLCRLMAPVLCYTAEEIWQELLALQGGERWERGTVHAEEFPEGLEVEEDRALLDRWERLLVLREGIAKALELARAEKIIGTSLEAAVTVEANASDTAFLQSFGDELRFLLLTGPVTFGAAGEGAHRSETSEGLLVAVDQAPGQKCARCWNYTEDVGCDPAWPGVCARCSGHIAAASG